MHGLTWNDKIESMIDLKELEEFDLLSMDPQ